MLAEHVGGTATLDNVETSGLLMSFTDDDTELYFLDCINSKNHVKRLD